MALQIRAAVRSDAGCSRNNNEDNFYLDGTYLAREQMDAGGSYAVDSSTACALFAVCDGMGGEERGEEASFAAVCVMDALRDALGSDSRITDVRALIDAYCKKANDAVAAIEGAGHAGTTFAGLCFYKNQVFCANLGDSRIYLLRDGKLVRISTDHTEAARLVSGGILTETEAQGSIYSHIVTHYIGMPESGEAFHAAHYEDVVLHYGDRFLLCSDGLTDMLEEKEIRTVLLRKEPAGSIVGELVQRALQQGGRDNVTALVVDVAQENTLAPDPKAIEELFGDSVLSEPFAENFAEQHTDEKFAESSAEEVDADSEGPESSESKAGPPDSLQAGEELSPDLFSVPEQPAEDMLCAEHTQQPDSEETAKVQQESEQPAETPEDESEKETGIPKAAGIDADSEGPESSESKAGPPDSLQAGEKISPDLFSVPEQPAEDTLNTEQAQQPDSEETAKVQPEPGQSAETEEETGVPDAAQEEPISLETAQPQQMKAEPDTENSENSASSVMEKEPEQSEKGLKLLFDDDSTVLSAEELGLTGEPLREINITEDFAELEQDDQESEKQEGFLEMELKRMDEASRPRRKLFNRKKSE